MAWQASDMSRVSEVSSRHQEKDRVRRSVLRGQAMRDAMGKKKAEGRIKN
jgi:hypothetical protein